MAAVRMPLSSYHLTDGRHMRNSRRNTLRWRRAALERAVPSCAIYFINILAA